MITKKNSPAIALLSPTWIVLGLSLVLPLLLMLGISFLQRGTYGGFKPVENFFQFLTSGRLIHNYSRTADMLYFGIYWRSLWMAVVTTVACFLLGYPIAYFIAIVAPEKMRKFLIILVVIPFWTCFLIRTYAWMFILRTEGLVNTVLLHMGIIHEPLPLLYNDFSVLVGLIYGELPFMILPIYASLEKLDLSLLEASKDLGASAFETFHRVTLPLTMPGVWAGSVLVFIPSIGQFIVSDLLGGAKSILIGNLIQNQFMSSRNLPFGAAVSIELILCVLLLLWLGKALQGKAASGKEELT